MKKFSKILIIVLIALAFFNPIHSKSYSAEETIRDEYQKLLGDISENLVLDNGAYKYSYDKIKNLVYDFDIESANKYLGGNWTHETFLSEIIINVDAVKSKPVSQEVLVMNTRSNCQINNINEYWNYYRIWADQGKSNTLANKYIGSANITGSVSVIAKFISEGFSAVGFAGYSATANIVSMLAGYHSGQRTSLANSIKNNNWSCGTMHEVDKFFVNVWKVEAQGIR